MIHQRACGDRAGRRVDGEPSQLAVRVHVVVGPVEQRLEVEVLDDLGVRVDDDVEVDHVVAAVDRVDVWKPNHASSVCA